MGLVALAILIAWESRAVKQNPVLKMVPGALVVVIVSILVNQGFEYLQPALIVPGTHMVRLPIFDSLLGLTREFGSPRLVADFRILRCM